MFDNTWQPLEKSVDPLTANVQLDENTVKAIIPFDYSTDGASTFYPWKKPFLPESWSIGVIVGGSGTGKTTLLKEFGDAKTHSWNPNKSIVSHFSDGPSIMYAVGLSAVPTWIKPYNVLSNGEKFRADLARSLTNNAVIDEYTSVVDRNVAKAASKSVANYIKTNNLHNIVIATCHRDIIEWLEPDWVIDTDAGLWCLHPQEYLQRPTVVAEFYEVTRPMWERFMGHHYLSTKLHPFARCWIAIINGEIAGFASSIPFPNGHIKRAWREHRTVTFPDFQGLGLGIRFSDWVAEAHLQSGYRYFSRTSHPRMGGYREQSPLWKPTSSNLKPQKKNANPNWEHWNFDDKRIAYSHEYVGNTKKESNFQ